MARLTINNSVCVLPTTTTTTEAPVVTTTTGPLVCVEVNYSIDEIDFDTDLTTTTTL